MLRNSVTLETKAAAKVLNFLTSNHISTLPELLPQIAMYENAEKYLRDVLQERFDPKKLPPFTK